MSETLANIGLGFIILSMVVAGGCFSIVMLSGLWSSQFPLIAKITLSMLGFSLILLLALMMIPQLKGKDDGVCYPTL